MIPSRTEAQRISLLVRDTVDVPFDETLLTATVVETATITAEITNGGRTLRLTGLDFGETLLFITTPRGRRTLMVVVTGRPIQSAKEAQAQATENKASNVLSGSYSVSFATPLKFGGERFLGHSYDIQRKLSNDRTLHIAGNLYQRFGQEDSSISSLITSALTFDQLTIGISDSRGRLDFMDSTINMSPLSFSGYAMRGLHITSTEKSRLGGAEFFAGIARPVNAFFGNSRASLLGGVMPLMVHGGSHIRTGFVFAKSQSAINTADDMKSGGVMIHTDARFNPDEATLVEAEVAASHNSISWRGSFALRRGGFNFVGGTSRLDANSPLVKAGIQSSPRTTLNFGTQWRSSSSRIGSSISYNRSSSGASRISGAQTPLSSSTLLGSLYFRPSKAASFNVRFADQHLSTSANRYSAPFKLQTRNLGASWSQKFLASWNNSLEVNITSSAEQNSAADINFGWSVRDELRRSWDNLSATLFFSHTTNSQSLASLVLANPDLLPSGIRPIFDRDPQAFLRLNRDELAGLLPGIELPQTTSTDAGLRLQGTLTRYTLNGEVRLSESKLFGQQSRDLLTNVGGTMRLDKANSLSINANHSFSISSGESIVPTVMLTYTHAFGVAGRGFGFAKLLKLDRGSVQGRVFMDMNGDGRDDAEEPGVPNIQVRLGERLATTDQHGSFEFRSATEGAQTLKLISGDLGVSLRASTATEQQINVQARKTVKIDFGVNNFGFIAGRIFNDLSVEESKNPKQALGNAPGIGGVQVRLRRSEDATNQLSETSSPGDNDSMSQTTDGDGTYQFRNLVPGSYTLEISPETLPPDYNAPQQTSWTLVVRPLDSVYQDVALTAQRAISGVVFVDRNKNNQFNADGDELVPNIRIAVTGTALKSPMEIQTNAKGSYLLRRLPIGKFSLRVLNPDGTPGNNATEVELGAEPVTRRNVNLILPRQ